jgi:hypothetical protein
MADRRLNLARLIEPRSRAAVQFRQEMGLAPLELGAQDVREEMVEAVPLALIAERCEEQVRAPQGGECVVGAFAPQDRVAEWSGHTLEDRATRHELL